MWSLLKIRALITTATIFLQHTNTVIGRKYADCMHDFAKHTISWKNKYPIYLKIQTFILSMEKKGKINLTISFAIKM